MEIFNDFEKFDLNKKTETVATDNTLPPEGAEEIFLKHFHRFTAPDYKERVLKAMQEYSSSQRERARNEAIQECIDKVFSMVGNTDFYPSQVARELSKLKG